MDTVPNLLRRFVALALALAVVLAACGTEAEPPATSPAPTSPAPRAVAPTSTVETTTTAAPATTVPVDPYETFVANIVDEVTTLALFVEPDGEPARLEFAITNPTYFGNPLALMVTDRTADGRWLRVQVPVRPNGTEAWIRTEDAEVTSHRFRAEVDLTARALTVWNGEEVVAETSVVIGTPTTPTPVGRFFVNDFVEKWEGSAYGPDILSLSGFSEALETFGGGIPVIAIHGTNRPELMGGAHSNGCIRIPNDIVAALAETVPVGTPVEILA
ncbi:MAG: L,D-transpeptidase [Acidimicrobiales bacterium]